MARGAYEIALRACTQATRRAATRSVVETIEVRPERLRVRERSWKGAEQSRIYSDWIAALLSPQDEIRGSARSLRARGRELARNNAYAGGFLEHVSTNVLGAHGIRMRAKNRDRAGNLDVAVNDEVEGRFREWFDGAVSADGEMSGVEFSDLALQTCAREGECFPRRVIGRDFPHGVALQLVDPDLVDDNYSLLGSGPEIFMGIEVDRLGRRLGYHVLDYPYGPGYRGGPRRRVSAGEMFQVYRPKRANQMRGVTWLARAMAALHDLERYQQNELIASATGAAKMGFITNDGGTVGQIDDDLAADGAITPAEGSDASRSRATMNADPGTILELEQGQKFEPWNPDHPSTAFGDFTKSVLRTAAAGLGVSYETLSADLSNVTYLSARAGLLIERAIYQRLQQWWIRTFQQRIFDWWLESAFLTGVLELPGSDWRAYRGALWVPRGWDWVDPSKDAVAAQQMLDLRLTTRTRLAAARGDDFEKILEETAEEQKLAARYNVALEPARAAASGPPGSPAPPPSGGAPPDPDAGDEDSEAETDAEEE